MTAEARLVFRLHDGLGAWARLPAGRATQQSDQWPAHVLLRVNVVRAIVMLAVTARPSGSALSQSLELRAQPIASPWSSG